MAFYTFILKLRKRGCLFEQKHYCFLLSRFVINYICYNHKSTASSDRDNSTILYIFRFHPVFLQVRYAIYERPAFFQIKGNLSFFVGKSGIGYYPISFCVKFFSCNSLVSNFYGCNRIYIFFHCKITLTCCFPTLCCNYSFSDFLWNCI